MLVKYVGKRGVYKDGLYGTGNWEQGQVKDVPPDAAMKMLGHPDQYQPASGEEVTGNVLVVGEVASKDAIKEALERVKVAFLDEVLETGAFDQESVEGLGVILSDTITAELVEVEKVVIEGKKEATEADNQEARDLVANMEKAQLDNYAMTNFQVKLHPNMSVENARKKVVGLIDQFGTH